MSGHDEYARQIEEFSGGGDRLWTPYDLMEQPTPQWLVDDLLIEGSMSVLIGKPGVGKSFFALELVMSIASGRPVLGTLAVQAGPTVYVVAEGVRGMGPRVRAWMEVAEEEAPMSSAFFFPRPLQLTELDEAQRFVALCSRTLTVTPKLVVIDTMARCMGGDENSAEDVGRFIEHAGLLQRELSCAVLIIHHPNKGGEQERGSTALRGAADMMASLKDTPEGLTLFCEKQKDAMPFMPLRFRLQAQGDSCVVMPPLITMSHLQPKAVRTVLPLVEPEGDE